MSEPNSKKQLKIMALIPARGGSKGVHMKALRMLGEMPLVAYTIRDALAIDGIDKVFVSTDNPEIQATSVAYGAEVPFLRPSELAQDDSLLEDAVGYSMKWYQQHEQFTPDVQIIMSPTHPFRRRQLVNNALKVAMENRNIMNIGSVAPWYGRLGNYWRLNDDNLQWTRFFDANVDYDSPLYQSAFSFNIVFLRRAHLPHGRLPVVLNDIESIDIDEPEDLDIARMVISEGLYPFDE